MNQKNSKRSRFSVGMEERVVLDANPVPLLYWELHPETDYILTLVVSHNSFCHYNCLVIMTSDNRLWHREMPSLVR